MNAQNLMAAMKRLAVISTATSVRKTELLTMRQDHGQPIRSFAAQVKGKAQVCNFTKNCRCNMVVDYTEDIVKYVVLCGIVDEEIKRNILGQSDLDEKSLNDTISLIENKEMASRAMSSSSTTPNTTIDLAAVSHPDQRKSAKDNDPKLTMKATCQLCNRSIHKYKLRRGKFKEFNHCIACWRKVYVTPSNSGTENAGAIFDTINSICNPLSQRKTTSKMISVEHHIFDGTYGWMAKESRKQPTVTLTIMKSSHKRHPKSSHLNCPSSLTQVPNHL